MPEEWVKVIEAMARKLEPLESRHYALARQSLEAAAYWLQRPEPHPRRVA